MPLPWQAFQILADNALVLARLDLVTGEYRIVKRDERLMGVSEEETLQLESYCEQLVAEKAIHPGGCSTVPRAGEAGAASGGHCSGSGAR